MDIDSFGELDFLAEMNDNDILELLDEDAWVDDVIDKGDTVEFDGGEFLEALRRQKPK